MKVIKQVGFEIVVHAWLKAEWYKKEFDPVRNQINQSVIESPDFDSEKENNLRMWLLSCVRGPILNPLPPDTIWHMAIFDMDDIKRTFIIPSSDWGIISSNTYHPLKVIENLNLDEPHANKIKEMEATLQNKSVDQKLILVASDPNSILTTIEGNHRGVAVFNNAIKNKLSGPIIDEVFLGISPNMKGYQWHIEKYMTIK